MPLGDDVYPHAFNAEDRAFLHIRQIGVGNIVAVEDHDLAAADGLQMDPLGDHHAGILAEANTNGCGVAGDRLGETTETSALHEMAVDHHVIDQAGPHGHFHATLDQARSALALIDHRAAHAHGTGAGPGDHEAFLIVVPPLHGLHEVGAAEDGGEAQLVAAADHHSVRRGKPFFHLRCHVLPFADIENVQVGHPQFPECFHVVLRDFFRDGARGGHQGDPCGRAAHLIHHAAKDTGFDKGPRVPSVPCRTVSLVLGSTDGDQFSFGRCVHGFSFSPRPNAVRIRRSADRTTRAKVAVRAPLSRPGPNLFNSAIFIH